MLYDIGFFIFSLFYLPTLIFKGKLHGDFLERFGVYAEEKRRRLTSGKDVVWIQAVSMGEAVLCRNLIPLIRQRFPERTIVISTITKAGNEIAKKLFSGQALIIYFPLDFSFIVRKVIRLINPRVYIMIETEIWPNLLKEAAKKGIPAILINGRISDRSFGKYKIVKAFLRPALKNIGLYCMQSELDAERIILLGAPPERVKITGNMKFDVDLSSPGSKPKAMKPLLGLDSGGELLVAGSTHGGEEDIVVSVYKKLYKDFPNLRLLIAPRHIERTGEVEGVIRKFGFTPVRLSSQFPVPGSRLPDSIFILDTIGQLKDAYEIATLVFIGGSLIPCGGHNPIEPAVLEKPVLFGPYMFTFKEIVRIFLDEKAALQVRDERDMLEKITTLLKSAEERACMGRNARAAILKNRGATEKNLNAIEGLIKK